MGKHAALTAVEWRIGRREQDELTVASHPRLDAAYRRGFYDDLVSPCLGLSRDQNLRPDTSLESLGAATGGRIVAGLAKALAERGGGRGLISICAAGGQGVVAVLER
jgi:acetyl-CoA acetyltransferase